MPAFAVVGGGESGVFYARQLFRAARAGRLGVEGIVVVDRDPSCAVSRLAPDPRLRLVTADWADWLDTGLDALPAGAQLVPYHWAPHLLREWLERQVRRHGGKAARAGGVPAQGLPWEGDLPSGDRALSYATWTCPVTCIEPPLCPHTRGPKDWSLAAELARPRADAAWDESIVFRSLHLAYGVGTIPVADILAARARLVAGLGRTRRYLVATSSHCHALAATLRVQPR